LTKVFVVLLVLFSIAFTSMTVSTATQTTNWRETAKRYEEHARVADTNLRHLIAANAAELAKAADATNAHLKKITQLENELEAARQETEQAGAERDRFFHEKSSAEALNAGLLAQLQSAEAARAEYRKQRDELDMRAIDLQRRNIDLDDRVNELTAQIAVQMEQKRQYEQQINILRQENERLAQAARRVSGGLAMEEPSGAAMTGVTALTPVAAEAIRGKVVQVSGDLVTVSIGEADGVRRDMVFVIHRDGEYVGDLKISLVYPNESAGRLIRARFTPGPGDSVTDALRLGGTRG
jgi:hypothetical protein